MNKANVLVFHNMTTPDMYRLVREVYPEACTENASDKHPELTDLTAAIKEEEDYFVEFLKRFFAQEQNTYFVLELDNQWVSALRLTKVNDFYYMEALATAPERRKKGYAAQLINEVIAQLSQLGPVTIRSNVNKKNEASLATHRKCGFVVEEENGINYLSGEQRDYLYGMLYMPTKDKWKVYFGGGFLEKKGHGHAGKEIQLNHSFHWGKSDWHLLSAYRCGKGLVLDLCVEASQEQMRSFIDKCKIAEFSETEISDADRECIETEHPLNVGIRASVELNRRCLEMRRSNSVMWIPDSCLPEGFTEDHEAGKIADHYGLDREKCYGFYRASFPWATVKTPVLKEFKLTLTVHPTLIRGERLRDLNTGDVHRFIHPMTGVEHALTVHSVEYCELNRRAYQDAFQEFPTNYVQMAYTLTPDIPNHKFSLKDCASGDLPRRKEIAGQLNEQGTAAAAIAIIGGADGPTAMFIAAPESRKAVSETGWHIACSSPHFKRTEVIEWQMEFREKLREDICIELVV